MIRNLIAAGACAAFVACATAPTRSRTTDRVVATTDVGTLRSIEQPSNLVTHLTVSPAAAMGAAAEVYRELGVELKLYEPKNGLIGNRRFSLYHRFAGAPMSTYLGCGVTSSGPGADRYRITMSLVTSVAADGTGSSVRTALEAKGEDPSASQGLTSCLTTGTLEEKVNALIAAKAAK